VRPDLRIELGGGAVLRPFTPDDAPVLFGVIDANRVRLSRWFHWVDGVTDEPSQRAFIESLAGDERSLNGNGIWVGDELAGSCNLLIAGPDDAGELGFWLDEAFVGRGLVTRGCEALINRGFESEGLHRIQLRAGVDNLRSRAVAKRLKMREEGVLRGAGKVGGGLYVDLVVYGTLVDEWRMTVHR
jgi:ribosomal-protein-serine acetyltransferase